MKACKVDEEQLAKWIDGATGAVRYLGPAITERIARKIIAAEKRTGHRCRIVVELNDEMDRSGYGETAGARALHDEDASIQYRAGLRIAALTAPGIAVIWSPIATRVDLMEHVSVNGIWMEGVEQRELLCWMSRMMEKQVAPQSVSGLDCNESSNALNRQTSEDSFSGTVGQEFIPVEPAVKLVEVDNEKIKRVEANLREHPPRDFKEERQTEVYQGYVGFIEIHVTGASLSGSTTLAIPKELTELGLKADLRNRLSEKMRIDLSASVDLGARDVNRRVDAFREIFTRQMGAPLGRIFRKSEWTIMQKKWSEIERLVEAANEKIKRFMHTAVQTAITDAAKDWAKAISENPAIESPCIYTEDRIRSLLEEGWDRKQRTTRMKVELFVKDLTWTTLNDPDVRRKIEEAYPDLRDTGLFKSRHAWTSPGSAT